MSRNSEMTMAARPSISTSAIEGERRFAGIDIVGAHGSQSRRRPCVSLIAVAVPTACSVVAAAICRRHATASRQDRAPSVQEEGHGS